MIIIKLTIPWNHDYNSQVTLQEDIKFEINNDCKECDFWFIWGGLKEKTTVKCPIENVIYITDEAHELRKFNQDFLNQFPTILAVRTDLKHKNIINIHEPHIWYFPKTLIELQGIKSVEKTEQLSIVASDLTLLYGHKKRFAFTNKLIGHFKDKIHVYGRGFNPIDNKWNAIAPYKYSVAIENNVIQNYFTEKLTECFLSFTMPIYYGCPNITDFFDQKSMILIDINDYKKSVEIIEKAIDENLYKKNYNYLLDSRNKFLNELHVFPTLYNFVKSHNDKNDKEIITIYPEKYFLEKENEKQTIINFGSHGLRLPIKILKFALKTYFKNMLR